MADIAALKIELDTDPLARGYAGMGDQAAADDINTVYRNAPAALDSIRAFLLLEVNSAQTLFGRIQIVAESAVGDDPIGETVPLTLEHITAAKSMMTILMPASDFSLDTNDSRFGKILSDLAGGTGCKAINPADKTALEAFSLNQQSRGAEIGVGFVYQGHIEQARA